ncbi:hypothetical protein FHP29_13685 [Nocardioides albidus]|uniref:Uncharacterized protein n=1 Tax=Nocardioides albidus TaxID=1517589 RepID=A0A5C4VR44_9ACTN|nr:hypothetical protein [Nocardioides albidus]TNM38320.1 hypothetical protein FHP29_13685 [Nocardioides albidus]
MWEQYRAPREPREQDPTSTQPSERSGAEEFLPVAEEFGSAPATGSKAGATVGAVAAGFFVLVMLLVGVVAASETSSSEPQSDYDDWYACIAEEEADGSGLLSPADLCELGHDRPPGYVDTYEYDPLGGGYGSGGDGSGGYGSGGYGR